MVKKKIKPKAPLEFGYAGRPKRFTLEEIDAFADELMEWLKEEKHIWFKDFCLDKDLDPDFMAEWAEESPKFRGAYTVAKKRQESRLVNGGLIGGFNSNITKLVLNHSHGWIEQTQMQEQIQNLTTLVQHLQSGKIKQEDNVDSNSEMASE